MVTALIARHFGVAVLFFWLGYHWNMHRPEEAMIFFDVSIQCATTIYAKAL